MAAPPTLRAATSSGYANYEIVPEPPQFAINPLTEVIDRFSTNIGLIEQQRQQVVPILKEELKQLEALKKVTTLSAGQG